MEVNKSKISKPKQRLRELRNFSPVMVSGVYRSGTTFLASLLGSHPNMFASSSAVKYLRFCLGRFGDINDPKNYDKLLEDSARRLLKRWQLNLDISNIKKYIEDKEALFGLNEVTDGLLYHLLMSDLHKIDPLDKSSRWVDKTAVAWSFIPSFLSMFPDGFVIHIIRDPRNVASSYKAMTIEIGNTFLDSAFNCLSSMSMYEKLTKEEQSRVIIVRAEDLAERPKEIVPILFKKLNLDPPSDFMNPNNLNAKGEDWKTNTSFSSEIKNWPSSKPRWPGYLSNKEINFIEIITSSRLEKFNYKREFKSNKISKTDLAKLLDSDFLRKRYANWEKTGNGAEGYKTDPIERELKIVFPERYK